MALPERVAEPCANAGAGARTMIAAANAADV